MGSVAFNFSTGGMGMAKGRKKKARKMVGDGRIAPTGEQLATGDFVSAGMAFCRTPVIDTMLKRGQISEREYLALGYYRDQASQAEDDAKRMSVMAPEKAMGGGGKGHPVGGYIPADYCDSPATLETARIERDLGILAPIANAIAVQDTSLSQWCIDQYGGRERYDGKGRFVAMVPNFEKRALATALLELKFAAARIVR